MPSRLVLPYGSWPSPISAELVARRSATYDAVHVDGSAVYWLETRPSEDGRTILVRWSEDGGRRDPLPPSFTVGTRIHEYGGGAYVPFGRNLFVSNAADDRLYRLDPGRGARAITPPPGSASQERYGDLRVTGRGERLVCVREVGGRDNGRDELVVLPTDGSAAPRVLTTGRDFYGAPRPNPDGRQLAWISWDVPQMPWDGTDLWVADLSEDGRLGDARHIAGGPRESVLQPEWGPDGALYFISDRTGWWNLYRAEGGHIDSLAPLAAEFADAPWEFDYSNYGFLADGRIVCRYRTGGSDHLAMLVPGSQRLNRLALSYTSIKPYLRVAGEHVVFIGATATDSSSVLRLDTRTNRIDVLAEPGEGVDPADISLPEHIDFPSEDRTAHAFYYSPLNQRASAPSTDRAPLLLRCHPGPTSDAKPRLDLTLQFFASRGFAVIDVNYAGSTGYGRAYREELNGYWGLADAEDCCNASRYIATAIGAVHPFRYAVTGSSAGGFTALCTLARGRPAAATSYFGVLDLDAFFSQISRFQAHHIHTLVGSSHAEEDRLRARSPMRLATRFSGPVLIIQGGKDTVVLPTQAARMREALEKQGHPYAYSEFPNEGHGFRHSASIKRALELEVSFYARILRLTPADPLDSIEVRHFRDSNFGAYEPTDIRKGTSEHEQGP